MIRFSSEVVSCKTIRSRMEWRLARRLEDVITDLPGSMRSSYCDGHNRGCKAVLKAYSKGRNARGLMIVNLSSRTMRAVGLSDGISDGEEDAPHLVSAPFNHPMVMRGVN